MSGGGHGPAIAAARLAFDQTTWCDDCELRARRLRQLHAALVSEREALRAELVAETGAHCSVEA